MDNSNKNNNIKCHVDSCDYYKNDYCYADKILVSPMTSSCDTSSDTMCDTYKSSDKNQ